MKRAFLIVLDSLGIGAMPDCADFGDKDCNTLKRISKSPFFNIPNLIKSGIGSIEGVNYLEKDEKHIAAIGRMCEKSRGKDTTIGHWEISGVISENPFPVYEKGFPDEIIKEFSRLTGRGVLCNKPYSGTKVIADYGEEHLKTGDLIVYTSADSVFQIAAHESVVDINTLYEYCKIARQMLTGEHAVGRVIARPFTGTAGNFTRTANRRDFALPPPKRTMLDAITENGQSVYSVGKISDIFTGRGISESVITHSDSEGIESVLDIMKQDFSGLCFANLVDFDMLYGHRQDTDGYAQNLTNFDKKLPQLLDSMREEDVLILTADHGCDPGDNSTDHTREYVPLLVFGKNIKPVNLGTRDTFSDISAFICDYLGVNFNGDGKSFKGETE